MAPKVPDNIGIYYGDCRPGRKFIMREPVTDKVTKDKVIECLRKPWTRLRSEASMKINGSTTT